MNIYYMENEIDGQITKWENVSFGEDNESIGIPSSAPNELSARCLMMGGRPTPAMHGDRHRPRMKITVSEPVKQGEGINAYISYKINTTTNRDGFKSSDFSVIRRYSNFVWLHSNLSQEYSGIIIPPLPEKLLVGRFSPEFIESRRRALEKFLNRTATHPELRHSKHVKAFLEASDERISSFKSDAKSVQRKASIKSGFFQWFDETVQQISTSLGSGVVIEKTPADIEFEEVQAYVDGLEPLMQNLHTHAQGIAKRGRETADGLFEFGVSFTLLGQSEGETLGSGLTQVGKCADKLSVLAAEQAEKESIRFEEPILDYIRLIWAVKAALQKRWDSKLTYETAIGDLESKRAIANKTKKYKGHAGKEEKYQQADMDVVKAQERADDAKLDFDIVTERVMREVERFKVEKLQDFRNIILDYIHLQIEYNQRMEELWQQVTPELEEIQDTDTLDSHSVPPPSGESVQPAMTVMT